MHGTPRHRPVATVATVRVATVLVIGAAVLAACGDDGGTSTSEDAAADTADTVCTLLRDWNNELAASLNATSTAITDADDPDTANQVLLDGWDELIAIAEGHPADVEQLDLPDSAVRDDLRAELTEGAEAAITVLEDEREEIAALPPITVDEQSGALGGAFVSMEKAHSVVEPRIGNYDDEQIRAAFQDDPGCEHVIQPF